MLTRIASIHWTSVKAERSAYGGYYRVEPVPRGAAPVILAVEDKIQRWEGPYSLSPTGTTRSKFSKIITGEEIAPDIVAEWTQYGVGMNPQCHPGIWMMRERIPLLNPDGSPQLDAEFKTVWRSATAEESEQMWQEDLLTARVADAAYAEMLIMKADQDAEDPRKIPFIPQKTKLAAKHYGVERDWIKEVAGVHMKRCPYCDTLLSAYVAVCKQCHNIVDPERYAELEAKKNAVLYKAPEESGEPALVYGLKK